ncbi:SHOCT domain-containing protein [Phascolarctobacterium faecium]|jgi:hypothetical protein|uniref:SHOCT domain-containing protein n=1 Tax=Phascolarctobacterium faecium TaxID=33025 RepID=UPI00206F465D|nr:SHOCT domain-containing protein [Phascolarctobacterium faecium]MBS5370438.1 hypothetical protein [Coprobacillus cateniformis]DAK98765.1 MAG TPA: hypothetical protein [Caudoviricetes sp.]
MQVTKLTPEQSNAAPKKHEYTEEEMQKEYSYMLAQQMTKKLFEKGMISDVELNKIMAKNKETFSPKLAAIMP